MALNIPLRRWLVRFMRWLFPITLVLASCSIGTETAETPGSRLFLAGDYAAAKLTIEQELATGNDRGAYALGEMYERGLGVAVDRQAAERVWVAAGITGEPKSMHLLSEFYTQHARCADEAWLASFWKDAAWNVNLISGRVEIRVPQSSKLRAANIYVDVCGLGEDHGLIARQWYAGAIYVQSMPTLIMIRVR
jgi:TPR repeat protein